MSLLLDRLLGKNFMSDVGATFNRKGYGEISKGEFTPGLRDQEIYDNYLKYKDRGYKLTKEGYDLFTKDRGNHSKAWYEDIFSKGFDDTKTGINPDTGEPYGDEDFSRYWVKPGEDKDTNIFSQDSILEGLTRAGLDDATPGMATPLRASDLRGLDVSSYTRDIEKERKVAGNIFRDDEFSASNLGAGFSGYGGRTIAKDLAQQKYEQRAEDIYANVNQQRAEAAQGIYGKLEGYGDLVDQYQG